MESSAIRRSRQGPQPGPRGLLSRLPVAAAVLGLSLGGLLIYQGLDAPTPPPQPTAAQGFSALDGMPAAGHHPSATPKGPAPLAPATPVRVRIPAIDVDAPLTALALESNGHLAAPPDSDRNLAGWYHDGTPPGAVGTAIIAGHVDTHAGRAVFYNLGSLKKNMTVDVDLADRITAVFTIDAVEAYDDNGFPSQKVYGNANRPELRLITCGAGFSKARQEYLGNVVVFAHLTSSEG